MQAINIVGKMENNFLFVEVWNKSADNRKDKVIYHNAKHLLPLYVKVILPC